QKLIPHLTLSSEEVCVQAEQKYFFEFDIAKITFISDKQEFSFADLSNGKILAQTELLQQMMAYLRQIENLDSVFANFEATVLQNFHLNDRFVNADFSLIACLLRGLQRDGWKISIAKSYKMNLNLAKNWYAEVKTEDDDINLELGIKIAGKNFNILPFLVKAIESGKWQKDTTDNLVIKTDNGNNIALKHKKVKQILSTLSELYDAKALNKQQKLTLTQAQLSRIKQLQDKFNDDNDNQLVIKADQWLIDKAKQLANSHGIENIKQPANLQGKLRDYQITGVSWLQFLMQHQLGGILADDMGLGKTLQILTHILLEKNNNKLKSPCLIIVPTTLLSNWQAEIQKYTPNLLALNLTGAKREKLYSQIENYDIIISSYGILARDIDKLRKIKFHILVLDEAQSIKNAKTQTAKAANRINAKQRICLTGTPIENHLGELWSLFNFLMPGFLGQKQQFEQIYQIPIERMADIDRQTDLAKRVAPFMLRRSKAQVAKELPEKTEITQIIELTDKQAELYETIRLSMTDEIKQVMQKQNAQNKIIIGNAMLRLRQICCHPALLKLESIDESYTSAKLNWLTTVLPNMLEEGRKILLFSSFTSMLTLIQQKLDELNIKSISLTGKTPANKRGDLIAEFQTGKIPVFLISLKAGGAGINLTTADTVIHFDPWWNPAAESQASDRAHRIGQDKKVFIYKLISKGTIEQRIAKLQVHKQHLAQSIFSQQASISNLFKDKQWQELLKPIAEN
ncbi:MAG TPA: DEAD/DEAH box helicase, partial [Oceanospirillales bacterium]|nr:DEAD/DEAH box helicase [Oceanospirillales bacterium]